MKLRDPQLLLQTAPFEKQRLTTPRLMVEVSLALAPVLLAAIWFFGITALLVVVAATAGAVVTEWGLGSGRPRGASLRDGSAILTGVLLGLTLPPGLPLWMAFLGGVAGIGLGKLVWGGLGGNLFNPALVGRAFLQASFPTAITTWTAQSAGLDGLVRFQASTFAFPMMHGEVDAITTATPLARMKFESLATDPMSLFSGNIAGSLGETSAVLLILCGLVLGLRRAFDWRVPVSILVTVAVLAGVIHFIAPEKYPSALQAVLSGGLLFGAVFMATDPVTSPISPRGAVIFGVGVGSLVVLIRLFGGLPEGVMYAILLMNAATPLIDRWVQPRVFGRGKTA